MKFFNSTFLLRFAVAVILLMHSIPAMLDNGIYEFGKYYLDEKGFSPVGLPLAWAIKLSHIAAAACLLLNRFVKPALRY
jgi:putative oxidoreductase